MTIHHETLRFERRFDCSPARLFEAYADTGQRAAWSAPGADAVVEIERSDLRPGGTERARCGGRGDLRWTLDTTYHVVEPDRTIAFTEVLTEGGRVLTVALVTFAISSDGAGCRLDLTDQVTSFVGPDGVTGHRQGYEAALANLDQMLVPA